MKVQTEIYFKKQELTASDWRKLIDQISSYHGFLKSWYLFVVLENRKIHYYIETSSSLPIMLEQLSFCMFKKVEKQRRKKVKQKQKLFSLKEESLLTLYDKMFFQKNKKIKALEIKFLPITLEKIYSQSNLYIEEQQTIIKRKIWPSTPTILLEIDLRYQKKFMYQKIPTYLNIQKSLSLFCKQEKNSILQVDPFPYEQQSLFLNITKYDFEKHSFILGSSGSGKSKLVSSMIAKLNKEEYKVIVIDPHAALEEEIGGLENTSRINFKEKTTSIDLLKNYHKDITASVELLLSLFENLMNAYYNKKLERVLRHSLHLLLLGNCFTFTNLKKLVLNIEYRTKKLEELKEFLPSNVLDFFYTDFNELKTKSYMESIAPILSFIDEMELLPAFQNEEEYPSLLEKLEENFLTIFSLDRTILGDHLVKTIAGFLMQQILGIMQSKNYKEKIVLVVDEVAVVENPILMRMLSEARKYGLSLILISQYFSQISSSLKDAIFANTINYYIFRTSRIDATLLVDILNIDIPEKNEKETKIELLTKLNNRECIVRVASDGKLNATFKATTLNYEANAYKEDIIEISCKEERKKSNFAYKFFKTNMLQSDILKKISTSRRK